MTIKIPVSADFDQGKLDQQLQQMMQKINALGRQIAQANKVKFEPVGKTTLDDMRKLTQQFETLKRVSGDLNRRINATGQSGQGFLDLDWSKMYPDAASRHRHMSRAFQYVTGYNFGPPAGGGGRGGGPSPQPGWSWTQTGNVGAGIVQSGLRATNGVTGGVGGVAANALGTGMSAGFGAGLMGLLGGVAALGAGKLVGAATEKLDQAEANKVAIDTLKRTLGDVNVSFKALESVVQSAAKNVNITFDEAGKLGQQFAKLGNIPAAKYGSLAGEIQTGVGLSRAFGLDPTQGIGFLGGMRGMRATQDENGSKRMALLIGETIAKSDAFAKSDDVMEAISSYVENQTRSAMGVPNVAGYAGMYSAMVGSGIPGMDPAGAGALLARMNATLSAGGGKGEASQFFTSRVGRSMGLDPFQMQVLREGGLFATNDQAFGAGSVYSRYMGRNGPGGGKTYLQGTIDMINRQYAGDDDTSKLMRAQAFANHAGINMSQAMGILSIKPNEMGEMQKYAGDLTKLNAGGIANMSKALFGSDADRSAIARSMLGRSDVSAADKAAIQDAQAGKGGKGLREVLAEISAKYDQERTQGQDIRDSKNALDNIKTSIAEKLIPLTQEMRHGIMSIAGGGSKTPRQIMEEVIKAESEDRTSTIEGDYKKRLDPLKHRLGQVNYELYGKFGTSAERKAELSAEQKRLDEEITKLKEEQKKLLDEENTRREREIENLKTADRQRWEAERLEKERQTKISNTIENDVETTGSINRDLSGNGPLRSYGVGQGGAAAAKSIGKHGGSVDAAMKYFQEAGWTKEQAAGIVSNLFSESNLRHNAVGDGGKAYGVGQWHPDRQANFKKWAGKDIRESTLEEQLAFVNYEMTEGTEQRAGRMLRGASDAGHAGSIVSQYYERPRDRHGEAAKRAALAKKMAARGTPLPEGGIANRGPKTGRFMFDDINIFVRDGNGQVMDRQSVATRYEGATPFGAEA